jgi:hypothetical protein
MDDRDLRAGEPALAAVLATLLAGIAIGAAAVLLANQQNELGGVKWPKLSLKDWRGKAADAVAQGRERIIRSVEHS